MAKNQRKQNSRERRATSWRARDGVLLVWAEVVPCVASIEECGNSSSEGDIDESRGRVGRETSLGLSGLKVSVLLSASVWYSVILFLNTLANTCKDSGSRYACRMRIGISGMMKKDVLMYVTRYGFEYVSSANSVCDILSVYPY